MVEGRGKKPILVWGGIAGEPATVRIVGRGKNQDYGVWLSSEKPSPYRTDPGCTKLSACGGCPLLHVNQEGKRALGVESLGLLSNPRDLAMLRWGPFIPLQMVFASTATPLKSALAIPIRGGCDLVLGEGEHGASSRFRIVRSRRRSFVVQ